MKIAAKKYIIFGLLATGSCALHAQTDSTLSRQISLQRDYTAKLKKSDRVEVKSYIFTPQTDPNAIEYIDALPPLAVNGKQVTKADAGSAELPSETDKKRGYVNAAGGNYGTFDGNAGYRLVNSKNDILSVMGGYSTTSGNIDYLQKGYQSDKSKAKYSDANFSLRYEHSFQPSILKIDASFFNTRYNYYGNTFVPTGFKNAPVFDQNSMQGINNCSLGISMKSKESSLSKFGYDGTIRYNKFNQKFGLNPDQKGISGGLFDLNLDLFQRLQSEHYWGVDFGFLSQSFGRKIAVIPGAFHSYTNFTATPYYKIAQDKLQVLLGVNLSGLFDVTNHFFVSPNAKISYTMNETNKLYASITGGVNNNTFLDILGENRYFDPISRIAYSKTLYDAEGGMQTSIGKVFDFNILSRGYKYTDNDHLYGYGQGYAPMVGNQQQAMAWGNVSKPIYANVSTGKVGFSIATKLIPCTDLSLKLVDYFYKVRYTNTDFVGEKADGVSPTAWGRPKYTLELNADVKPIDKLTCSLNYLLAGKRKAYFNNLYTSTAEVVSMNDINELNIRGEYKVTDWFAVNVKLNNLLFSKYETIYGYAQQRFSVLGGVSFKF